MDNNIGAKVDRDSLVEGGELLLKTEDEKADYGGDSKAQKMKQCCKVFVGVIAFILGLWVLAALSTPTCPSHIFGQTVEKLDVSKYAGEWYQMMVNKD